MRIRHAVMVLGFLFAVAPVRAQEAEVIVGKEQNIEIVGNDLPPVHLPEAGVRFDVEADVVLPNMYIPAKTCRDGAEDNKKEWCRGTVLPTISPFVGLNDRAKTGLGFTGVGVNFLVAGENARWHLFGVHVVTGTMGENYIFCASGGMGIFQQHRFKGKPKSAFAGRDNPYRFYAKIFIGTGLKGSVYIGAAFTFTINRWD